MSRRVTLPGADELFRTTGSGPQAAGSDDSSADGAGRSLSVAPEPTQRSEQPAGHADQSGESGQRSASVRQTRPRPQRNDDRRPSGRERHDEKITVYLSPDELIDLERARLALRQDHGMVVDRGRIVREAIALVLAELEVKGDSSTLVRRLRDA
jgi:hypothetical protein